MAWVGKGRECTCETSASTRLHRSQRQKLLEPVITVEARYTGKTLQIFRFSVKRGRKERLNSRHVHKCTVRRIIELSLTRLVRPRREFPRSRWQLTESSSYDWTTRTICNDVCNSGTTTQTSFCLYFVARFPEWSKEDFTRNISLQEFHGAFKIPSSVRISKWRRILRIKWIRWMRWTMRFRIIGNFLRKTL